MQVFEAVLHRKPTNSEIDKYSAYGPSQSSILNAIVANIPPMQSPDGCGEDACALHTLAGSNEDACEDSESDSDSDNDSDDSSDYDEDGIPSNEWKRPDLPNLKECAPKPYVPNSRIVFERAPEIDIKVSHKLSTPQPCLDRMDVLKRLQAICDDVESFKKYVTML